MRLFDGSWQVKGWFEHQNPLAMWCYLGALPILAMALWPKIKGRFLWLCLAGFGGAGLCILLSVSRAALAAYAAGSIVLLLLAWMRGFQVRTLSATVTAVCGAAVVGLFALDSFRARLSEVAQSSQVNELDLRDVLNLQSAAMLKDHPLLGIGWNNFGISNSRPEGNAYSQILEDWDKDRGYTIYDENYYANPLTESLYWLWLAETGWLGFASFLLFAIATSWWAVRNAFVQRGTLMGAVAAALAVGLLICYGHGTVERILTQTKNLSEWLMLSGMVAGMEMKRRAMARK
jgi:O-antigen ligase